MTGIHATSPSPSFELPVAVESWLDDVHTHLRATAPELAGAVEDYVGEARFGAACIARDLSTLAAGARILEVGAGAQLLSTALVAAGFSVTALEPVGSGFAHMARLRALVLDLARQRGVVPDELDIAGEHLAAEEVFDYAFSVNVMEHVADPELVLRRVWRALKPGAAYRFVCPNYQFPFEPHFGIPTLGSKALTWRVFERRILASPVVVDPAGTWASLNWISVAGVRRICQRAFGVVPHFERDLTTRFLRRAVADPAFQRRHGAVMRGLARGLAASGATRLATFLPPGLQPAMSCLLTRTR